MGMGMGSTETAQKTIPARASFPMSGALFQKNTPRNMNDSRICDLYSYPNNAKSYGLRGDVSNPNSPFPSRLQNRKRSLHTKEIYRLISFHNRQAKYKSLHKISFPEFIPVKDFLKICSNCVQLKSITYPKGSSIYLLTLLGEREGSIGAVMVLLQLGVEVFMKCYVNLFNL